MPSQVRVTLTRGFIELDAVAMTSSGDDIGWRAEMNRIELIDGELISEETSKSVPSSKSFGSSTSTLKLTVPSPAV